MPRIATFGTSEWHAAYEAARAVQPNERWDMDGIAVVTENGFRHWVAWDERLVFATTPTPLAAGDAVVTCRVPPRLVTYADMLAHVDGDVTFTILTEQATVSSASGELTIDLPDNDAIPCVGGDDGPVTVARVDPVRLRVFLHGAGERPWGLDPSGPTFWLAVGGGRISVELDWRAWRAPAACFAVPAETTGPATAVPIDHRVLLHLAELADVDEDLILSVPASGDVVRLATSRWVAELRTIDLTAQAWFPDVDAFFNSGFPHPVEQDEAGGWDIQARGTTIHAALVGTRHQVLRLTTTVASDVTATPDVLEELNVLSAGLVNVRLWWHDGDVIAGTDIPCPAVGDLAVAVVDSLVDQITDLGPFIAALAGPA
jgi:hypothetical protein